MKRCLGCGAKRSDHYGRVLGDNVGQIHQCCDCGEYHNAGVAGVDVDLETSGDTPTPLESEVRHAAVTPASD